MEGDNFYGNFYSLSKSDEWEQVVYNDYDSFSQAAVVYLAKEKVAEYGCTQIFD